MIPNPLVPSVAVHGTWVRSSRHDGFGRICYVEYQHRPVEATIIEVLVMWQPDKDIGTVNMTASYHRPEELEVRPFKPRPWQRDPVSRMEVYYENGDSDVRGSEEMSEV